jgi:hypothetical protein
LHVFSIDAPPLDIARELVRVAERPGELDAASADFADWIRERLRPIETDS